MKLVPRPQLVEAAREGVEPPVHVDVRSATARARQKKKSHARQASNHSGRAGGRGAEKRHTQAATSRRSKSSYARTAGHTEPPAQFATKAHKHGQHFIGRQGHENQNHQQNIKIRIRISQNQNQNLTKSESESDRIKIRIRQNQNQARLQARRPNHMVSRGIWFVVRKSKQTGSG